MESLLKSFCNSIWLGGVVFFTSLTLQAEVLLERSCADCGVSPTGVSSSTLSSRQRLNQICEATQFPKSEEGGYWTETAYYAWLIPKCIYYMGGAFKQGLIDGAKCTYQDISATVQTFIELGYDVATGTSTYQESLRNGFKGPPCLGVIFSGLVRERSELVKTLSLSDQNRIQALKEVRNFLSKKHDDFFCLPEAKQTKMICTFTWHALGMVTTPAAVGAGAVKLAKTKEWLAPVKSTIESLERMQTETASQTLQRVLNSDQNLGSQRGFASLGEALVSAEKGLDAGFSVVHTFSNRSRVLRTEIRGDKEVLLYQRVSPQRSTKIYELELDQKTGFINARQESGKIFFTDLVEDLAKQGRGFVVTLDMNNLKGLNQSQLGIKMRDLFRRCKQSQSSAGCDLIPHTGPQSGMDIGDFYIESTATAIKGEIRKKQGYCFVTGGDEFHYCSLGQGSPTQLEQLVERIENHVKEDPTLKAIRDAELLDITERLKARELSPGVRAELEAAKTKLEKIPLGVTAAGTPIGSGEPFDAIVGRNIRALECKKSGLYCQQGVRRR